MPAKLKPFGNTTPFPPKTARFFKTVLEKAGIQNGEVEFTNPPFHGHLAGNNIAFVFSDAQSRDAFHEALSLALQHIEAPVALKNNHTPPPMMAETIYRRENLMEIIPALTFSQSFPMIEGMTALEKIIGHAAMEGLKIRQGFNRSERKYKPYYLIDTSGMKDPAPVRTALANIKEDYDYPVGLAKPEWRGRDLDQMKGELDAYYDRMQKLEDSIPKGQSKILRRNENEIVVSEKALRELSLPRKSPIRPREESTGQSAARGG